MIAYTVAAETIVIEGVFQGGRDIAAAFTH